MKVLFLDHDGVICLYDEWGSRNRKQKKLSISKKVIKDFVFPVEYRFDNFNKKAIRIINEIIEETKCEIVVSSDWRLLCTIEEMGEYYLSQGIIKEPIDFTVHITSNYKNYGKTYNFEKNRVMEIEDWLYRNPDVTNWVAVDDLNLGELDNFIRTPYSQEGIKQSGVKEKIIKYLM